jgi:hypothetical protein
MNKKNSQRFNYEFAEKCRKALEQSYGGIVPVPKRH